jgi:hypothetical protein
MTLPTQYSPPVPKQMVQAQADPLIQLAANLNRGEVEW